MLGGCSINSTHVKLSNLSGGHLVQAGKVTPERAR